MSLMRPITFLLAGNTPKTIRECDEILSRDAHPDPGAVLMRGWAHIQRGDYEEAEQDCSRFIHTGEVSEGLKAPALSFAYRMRATCYEHQGEWNLALSDLKKALDFYEDDTDVDTDDFTELREQQRRVERKKLGESSQDDISSESAAPLSRPPRHEVLKALVDGDLQRALELCEEQLDDINIRFLYGLAQDLRGRRSWADSNPAAESDFKDAISAYSDVIEDATSHFLSRAYVRRSHLQIALENPKEALEGLDELEARQLLDADEPLNIHAFLSRGIAALKLYEYDKAGAAFDYVLDLDKKNIRALDGNGQVDLYTEDRRNALKRFKAALEIAEKRQEKPNVAHFTFMIALTHYLDEEYDQAITTLKKIEPIMGELQDSQRRQLQQKIAVLEKFLPFGIPDSEKKFEEQRQLFKSSAVQVKFTIFLGCFFYQLSLRNRPYRSVAP